MKTKIQKIIDSYFASLTNTDKRGIVQFAREEVAAPGSARNLPTVHLDETPWLIEPLEACLYNRNEQVTVQAPTGGGKSTLITCLVCWIIARDPGPTMIVLNTDSKAEELAETRIMPAITRAPAIMPLLPDKGERKKDALNFGHMPLKICGSGINNLQGTSVRYAIADETHLFEQGRIGELRKRTHSRYNQLRLYVSQGGSRHGIGRDWYYATLEGEQHKAHMTCRTCNESTLIDWDRLKIDTPKTKDGAIIYKDVTCSYVCSCGEIYKDEPNDRRAISDSVHYVSYGGNYLPRHKNYHFNYLVTRQPWAKEAVDYLKTIAQAKKGNMAALGQFKQKVLGEHYDQEKYEPSEMDTSDRTKQIAAMQTWDVQILSVDIQGSHYWQTTVGANKDGKSCVLSEGKLIEIKEIHELAAKMTSANNFCLLDEAWSTEFVRSIAVDPARATGVNYYGINGQKPGMYRVRKRGGVIIERLIDEERTASINGQYLKVHKYSGKHAKDRLAGAMGAGILEFPLDVSKEFRSHIGRCYKEESGNWKEPRENHLWDCLVMTTAFLVRLGIY